VLRKAITGCLLACGVLVFLVLASAIGENEKPVLPSGSQASCGDCHTCSTPSAEQPCLRKCPRFSRTVIAHSPEEGPSVAILDQLSDQFVPVIFPHKLHAQMEGMAEGCGACHHHSPAGHIPPCRECHGGPSNPQNLNQPSLKGAYHRHCMGCHREWSHDTECVVCHAKKTGEVATAQVIDTTDIMGMLHPNIEEPDKRVYQTDYNGGTVVTFHHKQHIDLFGLKCVDCHQKEGCGRCHDIERGTLAKSLEEHHEPCASCHDMNGCGYCHAKEETKGFNHARVGWPLSRHHRNLKCQACHPPDRKIGKLDRECVACHSSWSKESFDHSVTGLILDELHVEMDCADCHADRKFDQPPSCVNCHDDGRTYPESSPGTPTGRNRN
jgi:hypothetical protein